MTIAFVAIGTLALAATMARFAGQATARRRPTVHDRRR